MSKLRTTAYHHPITIRPFSLFGSFGSSNPCRLSLEARHPLPSRGASPCHTHTPSKHFPPSALLPHPPPPSLMQLRPSFVFFSRHMATCLVWPLPCDIWVDPSGSMLSRKGTGRGRARGVLVTFTILITHRRCTGSYDVFVSFLFLPVTMSHFGPGPAELHSHTLSLTLFCKAAPRLFPVLCSVPPAARNPFETERLSEKRHCKCQKHSQPLPRHFRFVLRFAQRTTFSLSLLVLFVTPSCRPCLVCFLHVPSCPFRVNFCKHE